MSDKGEKTCPLCTEEMDLTDQQLKACKCEYEICVWCWHHIMGMAEKDGTDGRCPACRAPYDKEKIVGMAANCGSLVAEISLERKHKVQKARPKASEGRKHLSSARVIQRNLVHVNGLPLSLADEELLKRCEYFGQYGKVLKASISRTANGVIHHSSNDCCSIYVTYSKEEEAVRCIQSVHNYILEGRSLRACFGTTKYCNSWLKNVPCSNPHCLYLHDFGSHEDSFNKDEFVSSFTRNTVQQVVGATHNMQRRSGNVLPPPADDNSSFIIASSAKPLVTGSYNNTENQVKGSVPDVCTGKSTAPPMAAPWVACSWSSGANSPGLNGLGKQKPDTSNGPRLLPSVVASEKNSELDAANTSTVAKESLDVNLDGKLDPSESGVHYIDRNSQTTVSKKNAGVIPDATPTTVTSNNFSPGVLPSKDSGGNIAVSSTPTNSIEFPKQLRSSGPDKDGNLDENGKLQNLNSGLSSISVHKDKHSTLVVPSSSISNIFPMEPPRNRCLQQDNSKQHREPMTSSALKESIAMVNAECVINGYINNKANSFTESDMIIECCNRFPDVKKGIYPGRLNSDVDNVDNLGALDMGENQIISNILSDLDSWDDPLTSSHIFANLLAETDIRNGSYKLPIVGKIQNSNQSRFLFAKMEDLPNQIPNLEHSFNNIGPASSKCSLPHGFLEDQDFPMDKCQNILSSSSFTDSNITSSSHPLTSSKKLPVSGPRISAPPGFSAPSRPPPPRFSSHNLHNFSCSSPANHLLQTPISSGGQIQFPPVANELNDPAILEMGKGIQTTGLNNLGGDMWQNLFPQPSPFEHEARHPLPMQPQISQHHNPSFVNNLSTRFNAYSNPRMRMDPSGGSNLPPFEQFTAQQHLEIHNQMATGGSWNEVKSVNSSGYEDVKFKMRGTGNLYTREFGI